MLDAMQFSRDESELRSMNGTMCGARQTRRLRRYHSVGQSGQTFRTMKPV